MHSTAEDSISSSTIAAGDGREVAAAAAAVATNTTTTASHSYYNLCNFFWSAEEGHKILRGRLNSRVLYLLKTERERDRENGTEDDDDRGNEVTSATHGGIGGAGRFR